MAQARREFLIAWIRRYINSEMWMDAQSDAAIHRIASALESESTAAPETRKLACCCLDARTGDVGLWLDLPAEGASGPDAKLDRKTARWLARQLLDAADTPDDIGVEG